ncbi:hypothetical protein [Cellvibrio mixtus]|uniref:hypothetical protein n=1 Tax=Cellvibrio mixtus TaxID=39650 RepID=UPI00069469F0|nr:hypothetical protein [Cellvibrio mixtus]
MKDKPVMNEEQSTSKKKHFFLEQKWHLYLPIFLLGFSHIAAGETSEKEIQPVTDIFDDVGLTYDNPYQEKMLWGGNRKFIYQQDFARVLSAPTGTATNRSSLRFQWNKVAGQYYFNADIKPIVYWNGDDSIDGDRSSDADFKIKELYAKGSFGNTTVMVGDKIIVWGESDSTAVTDVISPQNITDLVFTSLDESRISQTMLIVEHYVNSNQISLIINPDIEVDEQPLVAQGQGQTVESRMDDKDAEIGINFKTVIGNGDFSLMFADLTDNQGVDVLVKNPDTTITVSENFYKNYLMAGAAANLNFGDIALKLELAYNKDRAQELNPDMFDDQKYPYGYGISDEVLFAANIDYQENGVRDWSAGILHSRYESDRSSFVMDEGSYNELFFGVTNKFMHENLTVGINYQHTVETKAAISQLSLRYSFSDDLALQVDFFDLRKIGGTFNQTSAITRLTYSF